MSSLDKRLSSTLETTEPDAKKANLDSVLSEFKLCSFNINGIRNAAKKNILWPFIESLDSDIICLQEHRVQSNQTGEFTTGFKERGYTYTKWNCSTVKKGASGVMVASKIPFTHVASFFSEDKEGRVICLEFDQFYLINLYVVNSGRKLVRLDYRIDWDASLRKHLSELDQSKPIIVTGDLNVAHNEIDLANPASNRNKSAGFTDKERESLSTTLESLDLVDSFRFLYPEHVCTFPDSPFDLLCQLLSANSSIQKFNVKFFSITPSQAIDLSHVFSTNTSLKSVSLVNNGYSLPPDQLQPLFESLASSSTINTVDLRNFVAENSSCVLPLFTNSTFQTLFLPNIWKSFNNAQFPAVEGGDVLVSALKDNSLQELQHVTFQHMNFNNVNFSEFLKSNTFLNSLEILNFSHSSAQFFHSLKFNISLKQLMFHGVKHLYTSQEFESILKALETNSTLLKVGFPNLNFSCLLLIFENIVVKEKFSKSFFDLAPHAINLDEGSVRYESEIEDSEIVSLLNALKINVPVKRDHIVEVSLGSISFDGYTCNEDLIFLLKSLKNNISISHIETLGYKGSTIQGIVALFQILSINTSIIDLDIFPNFIDVDNGVLQFSPKKCFTITAEEISSLKYLLDTFTIKEFSINGCRLNDELFNNLCDFFFHNKSLTSIEFSSCDLSDQQILTLFQQFVSNSNSQILTITLMNNSFSNQGLTDLLELLKGCSSIIENIEIHLEGNPLDRTVFDRCHLDGHVKLFILFNIFWNTFSF
ncbi:hypothetical protein GEMRC1_006423 [Eukaryota sp. GEM-RC1]